MKDVIGSFCLINDQMVSVSELKKFDLGLDSPVYEVLRVEDGILLFVGDHLRRLKNTFSIVSWEGDVILDEIPGQLAKLIEQNKIRSGAVKLLFFYFRDESYSVYYQMQPYSPSEEEYKTGIKTISLPLERLNPNAKTWNEGFRKKTNTEIQKKHVFEAILIDRDGFVTEGSRSNIFFVKDNTLFTPPLENVLPGITRKNVLEVCRQLSGKIEVRPISFQEIAQFDAAFLTGTTRILVPISKIDDIRFNVENPLVERIIDGFKEIVRGYIAKAI
ncbi:MAG: aminotransferase class IV [Bacteroidetes bacterium]|nr:MAG: aminotransferase class IV [Bacteroidota bacterium]